MDDERQPRDGEQNQNWRNRILFFVGGGLMTAGLLLAILMFIEPTGEEAVSEIKAPESVKPEESVKQNEPPTKDEFSFYQTLNQPEPDPEKFMKLPGVAPDAADDKAGAPAPSPPPATPALKPTGSSGPKSAPSPKPKAETPPKPVKSPAAKTVYLIQVAAFSDAKAAKALADKLSSKGYPARVVEKRSEAEPVWFRVRIGPYGDSEQAKTTASRIRDREGLPTLVVKESG